MTHRLVVGDTVVRARLGASQRQHTRQWRAHRPGCRYATGEGAIPLAELVEAEGTERVRLHVIHRTIEPCRACRPTLIEETP